MCVAIIPSTGKKDKESGTKGRYDTTISHWQKISNYSGFWPSVHFHALLAPVFVGSLTGKTGRCAPPTPLIIPAILMILKEKTLGKIPVWEKIRESVLLYCTSLVIQFNNA